jgi:hypothetical protein
VSDRTRTGDRLDHNRSLEHIVQPGAARELFDSHPIPTIPLSKLWATCSAWSTPGFSDRSFVRQMTGGLLLGFRHVSDPTVAPAPRDLQKCE